MSKKARRTGRDETSQNRWLLRVGALLISTLLWLFVSFLPRLELQSEARSELEIDATVLYENPQPEDLMILNRDHQIRVLVRGRESFLRGLDTSDVNVRVPFPTNFVPNEPIEVRVGTDRVGLPEGLEAVSVIPETVTLLIDGRESVQLPVRVNFTGEPAAGVFLDDVHAVAVPAEVTVQGPRSRLQQMREVTTAPINLDGKAVYFEERTEVRTDDPAVRVVRPSLVTVEVYFGPIESLTVEGSPGS